MCALIPLSIVICMINVYGAVSSNPKAFLSHYTIYKEACHKMGFVRKGCKNTELTRKIAFMAMPTNNVRTARGATVPFKTVITNEGNAYKRQTSTFTAPVAGNYFFSLSVGMPTPRRFRDYYRIHITKNNKPTSYIFIAPTGKWEMRTENIILHLSRGDRVNVKIRTAPSNFPYLAGGQFHSHFSGFLIN